MKKMDLKKIAVNPLQRDFACHFNPAKNAVVESPMGYGKTLMALHTAQVFSRKGKVTVIVCPHVIMHCTIHQLERMGMKGEKISDWKKITNPCAEVNKADTPAIRLMTPTQFCRNPLPEEVGAVAVYGCEYEGSSKKGEFGRVPVSLLKSLSEKGIRVILFGELPRPLKNLALQLDADTFFPNILSRSSKNSCKEGEE